MIKNYTLSAVSSKVEFGKRGGTIVFTKDGFALFDADDNPATIQLAESNSPNAPVTNTILDDRIIPIETGDISRQVIVNLTGTADKTDFTNSNGIVINKANGNLSVLHANGDAKVILNQDQTNTKYWKSGSSQANTIYVQDTDPSLVGTVAEGSIWFKT